MSKVKKLSIWLSVSLAILVVLIGVAFYVASNLIQKDSVKEKIHTLIAKKTGGDVDYESMNLHFFHWPHILIRNAKISIPEKVEGSFDSVVVYPKILPLLYGNVEVSEVKFGRPQVKLYIPEKTKEKEEESTEPATIVEYKALISDIFNYLNAHWKGLDARIDYGKLKIVKGGQDFLDFNNLNAVIDFPNNTLSYRVYSNSNISQTINLKGSVDTKAHNAAGQITLNRFKPHLLLEYLFPDNKLISKSNIDIDLDYKSKALDEFNGNLIISNSELTLTKGKDEFQISGNKIDTDIYHDEDKSVFTINKIDLAHPDIHAAGEHRIDRKEKNITLNLNGNNINVESSRDAVLFVAGDDRIVDLIFNIVRGGTIPKINLQASGDDFRDLWRRGNFELRANLIDGNIFVPYGDFDLTDVSGDALIAEGKLTGTNLRATSNKSKGYGGTFIIGIEGPVGPLHLDISVDADASEVPAIIEKFVDDKGFLHELSLIENIKGNASGKLKIGETKKDPETSVLVSDLDMTADYKRVPAPVNVKGNKFEFADKSKHIEFDDLKVNIGKLSSPATTGSYHWKEDKTLKISTKDIEVDLDIIFPWLSSFEMIRPHLRHIKSINGSAFLNFANFAGPVNKSEEWEISAEGKVNSANLNLDGLDSDMTISEAEIKTTTEQLSISNTTVDIKESKMNVGVVFTNYLTDWFKLQMDFYGNMLANEAKLFSDYFNVPSQINFNSPVSISESSVILQKKPVTNNAAANVSQSSNSIHATKELDLDINVIAESMEWADSEPETPENQPDVAKTPLIPDQHNDKTILNGKVLIKSDNFEFKGFNWDEVNAEVAFLDNRIDVNVNEANLCGIATPGVFEVTSPNLKLQFEPFGEEENLAHAIKCLFDKAGIITGDFDLGGTINSNSEIADVMTSIEGELELTSSEGRVTKYGGLARFFSALNFGEIFRGNKIDFEDEGFPYKFIKASASIEEGKLIIREAAMDGPSLKIVCDGWVDLINDTLDLKVVVIPVLAVDSVIEKIPLISMVLGKDVVSIPIKVTGDISDPKVSELSPHTIGAGLLGIIKQTLNIPVTLVKPLDSGKKKEKAEAEVESKPESDTGDEEMSDEATQE